MANDRQIAFKTEGLDPKEELADDIGLRLRSITVIVMLDVTHPHNLETLPQLGVAEVIARM